MPTFRCEMTKTEREPDGSLLIGQFFLDARDRLHAEQKALAIRAGDIIDGVSRETVEYGPVHEGVPFAVAVFPC